MLSRGNRHCQFSHSQTPPFSFANRKLPISKCHPADTILQTPFFSFENVDLLVQKNHLLAQKSHTANGRDYKNSAMTVNATGRVADWLERNILLNVSVSALIAALCTALLAHTAQADTAAAPESEARPAAHWRGQRCTLAGCTRAPANPWLVVVGFGGAALAAGWLGRRLSGSQRSSESSWTSRKPDRPSRVGSAGRHPPQNRR